MTDDRMALIEAIQKATKDLVRCVILEHFSGRIVQSVNNVIELFLGNASEICPFGKVSPKQSIGIFVGPPLLWQGEEWTHG